MKHALLGISLLLIAGVAEADDLALFTAGQGPPNILFLFDTSGSMNNMICEDLTTPCNATSLVAKSAPNSSTICQSSVLAAIAATSPSGGANMSYVAPYASDGTTYQSSHYSVYDSKRFQGNGAFPTATIYAHGWNKAWTQLASGGSGATQAMIDAAVAAVCNKISDCNTLARCIFSMRTQGYFWEPSGNTCGSGNPYNTSCSSSPYKASSGATPYVGPQVTTCTVPSGQTASDATCVAPTGSATCGTRPVITTRSPAKCSTCNTGSATVGSNLQCGCNTTF